jgi:hypothetical protein
MVITSQGNQLIIKIPRKFADPGEIQKIINFIRGKSILAKTAADNDTAVKLAKNINRSWWKKNKNRILNP